MYYLDMFETVIIFFYLKNPNKFIITLLERCVYIGKLTSLVELNIM